MQRQPDAESRAASKLALDFDAAVVGANDPLNDHETQAGPFFLCRVERLEQPVDLVLGMPPPVSETLTNTSSELSPVCSVSEPPRVMACMAFLTKLTSTCWIWPASIGLFGSGARQPGLHLEAPVFQFRPEQLEGFEHDIVEGSGFELRRRRPDRLQKLRHNIIQAVYFAFGDAEILL